MSISLDRGTYEEVLTDLGMWHFPNPVEVGNPGRRIHSNPTGFFHWFEQYYGRPVPLYIGHNAFARPPEGNPLDRSRYLFGAGFGDADDGNNSGLSVREVLEEVQRLAKWLVADEQSMSHVWLSSGRKGGLGGFHVRPFFEEEVVTRSYLERWEPAFWRGLANHLSLRSLNPQCFEPTRLERLPFTPYVTDKGAAAPGEERSYVKERNFCVPVPWEWVVNGEWQKIVDLSYDPEWRGSVAFKGRKKYYIESFVRLHGWESWSHEVGALHPAPEAPPQGQMADLMEMYFGEEHCISRLIFGANPRHEVRRAWICNYANLEPKPSLQNCIEVADLMAEEAKWTDRMNTSKRRYQVEYHYRRNYSWTQYCRGRREHGICVGTSCPKFAKEFPLEYAEWLKTHAPPKSEPIGGTVEPRTVSPSLIRLEATVGGA
jgi:hypothetical protein